MNWYYADGNRPTGPVSEAEFGERVRAGAITAETLVWCEGMADWQPYGRVSQGGAATAAPPPATPTPATPSGSIGLCSQCGRAFPPEELVRYENATICAACKPAFFQRLQEAGRISAPLEYAGFWIRAGAKILDQLLLYFLGYGVGLFLTMVLPGNDTGEILVRQFVGSLLGMLISLTYTTWFLGTFGATPGKMACGLKVVTAEGNPIGYGRACGRYFAEILSGLILAIGYLMVAFDEEKRALHDRLCGTRVVRKG